VDLLHEPTSASVVETMYCFAEREARKGSAIYLPRPYDGSFPVDGTGIDSLHTAELAVFLEERFRVEIDFAALLRSKTLADVVAVVLREDRR
jgi:hypothetical protein